MIEASFFMSPILRESTMRRVSVVSGTWSVMKSEDAKRVSRSTIRQPSDARVSWETSTTS